MKEKMTKIMKNEKGFTLIEMIVVMAIIGVLAAILIPSMSGFINNANRSKNLSNGRTFQTAAAAAITELSAQGTSTVANKSFTSKTDAFGQAIGKLVKLDTYSSFQVNTDANGAIDDANSWVQIGTDRYSFSTNTITVSAAPSTPTR